METGMEMEMGVGIWRAGAWEDGGRGMRGSLVYVDFEVVLTFACEDEGGNSWMELLESSWVSQRKLNFMETGR